MKAKRNYLTTYVLKGVYYVLCDPQSRTNSNHRDADFMGTGLALCGRLKPGQSLENWAKRRDERRRDVNFK